MAEAKYAAPAVERGLDILETMATESRSFTATEMANKLNISVNSAFRIFIELEKKGYVLKNAADSSYELTTKLYFLGSLLHNRISLIRMAQPSMKRILEQTRETVLLTRFGTANTTLVIDQAESPESIKFLSTVGREYPSYNSALGKAMLSALDMDALKQYVQTEKLEQLTPSTITNPELLLREILQARENGIAFDRAESVIGLSCMGCPIYSAGHKLEGAIGISGISFRMTQDKIDAYIPLIKQEAARISRAVGCED